MRKPGGGLEIRIYNSIKAMQEIKPINEFDYQAYVVMEPKAQEAYLEICKSLLESGTKTIVLNGPDAGRTIESVEELKEWLSAD